LAVVVVAGVDVAPRRASPATSAIAYVAALSAEGPVADIAADRGAVTAALTWVIPRLLAALPVPTRLLAVATLSATIASLLPAPLAILALSVLALSVLSLAILSLTILALSVLILSVLAGPAIAAARSRHSFNLVAQPLDLIECHGLVALLPCAALSRLALAHSLLRLA
jgi:hypothetical protein